MFSFLRRRRAARTPATPQGPPEQLETRALLAGDVTAAVSDAGELEIRGDATANGIVVYSRGENSYGVRGLNHAGATTVNGQAVALLDGVTRSIYIDLRGGADRVVIVNLETPSTATTRSALILYTGGGRDVVGLRNVDISASFILNTDGETLFPSEFGGGGPDPSPNDPGRDRILLREVTVGGETNGEIGGEVDLMDIRDSDFQDETEIEFSNGADYLRIGNSTFNYLLADGEEGDNRYLDLGGNDFRGFDLVRFRRV